MLATLKQEKIWHGSHKAFLIFQLKLDKFVSCSNVCAGFCKYLSVFAGSTCVCKC